ncbi:MAG: outer membrane protein assembly factor BamA [Gammaproteobacteria bacterium]|nr:outer membrane protein assembly factor BamA [Gammaproteobacteria bacterium]
MRYFLFLFLLVGTTVTVAVEQFTVTDIRVEGLHRISPGTVFNYLPVKVGQTLDPKRTGEVIRALFKTGFFKDVRLEREGDVLVVFVVERPSIASIAFEGNSSVETEALLDQLKQIGFAEGRVFDQSLLDRVEQEMRRMYFGLGKYAARIQTTVTPLERNRLGVSFDISEGAVATIKQVNIVGNTVFEDDDLLELFELSTPGWFSAITKDDQYSKQKLSGDLEALRSYYLDRGFINFNIESTQVSLTPDKRHVYITINIDEGDRFSVGGVKLAGDIVVPEEELFKLIGVGQGEVFSRKKVTETTNKIVERLGDDGYAFANVNAIPDIGEEEKTVALTFFVDPGKRVYVRRINFKGNSRTRDEVLRQEMRQIEGAWISTSKVKRSQTRLEKLGYFDSVNVETPAVAGTTDQVDVNYSVEEKPSGNLMAGVGYSQSQGIVFSTSVSQENFLGSGKKLGFGFNNSKSNRVYSFSYDNPYWTIDGVSRGFSLYRRETDAADTNVADYSTDRMGGSVRFGVPINEFDRVNVALGIEQTDFKIGNSPSVEVLDFLNREGDEQTNWDLSASWVHDSRNRAVFPDRGSLQRFSGELTLPGSDLTYFKVGYSHHWYYPFLEKYTLLLKGELGYGDGYGDTDRLPLYDNYYTGGIRSVRGYEDNSLGGRDSKDDPLGGDLKVVGNAEVILPVPFVKDSRSVRLSGFFDLGTVYGHGETFDSNALRSSVGIAASWISPMGALTFSLAQPLNDKSGDDIQQFQFTMGSLF